MQKLLFSKIGLVGGLILLLMIPLSLIKDVVSERISYRAQARAEIEQSWTGQQSVVGPLLVVPYEEEIERQLWDEEHKTMRTEVRHIAHKLIILPEALNIDGDIQTEERKLGLYSVPVYTAEMHFSGRFDNRAILKLLKENEHKLVFKPAYVSVLVQDLRGVIRQPSFNWAGKAYEFDSGNGLANSGQGMRTSLGELALGEEQSYAFSFDFLLRGMESLNFAPLGRDTQVQLDSPWPHPSFVGRYLPSGYEVDEQGFKAQWYASSFSSGMAQVVEQCASGQCGALLDNTFGVSLIKTVDIYLQAERSLKYGVLFLTLTFAIFFLYEVLKRLSVHPIQYLFVGMAMTIFYLLLVSFSEHIPFALAYTIAAGACSSLLGVYIGSILRSLRSGALFFGAIVFLYAVLYHILQSEDNALLMGSVLLFAVLSAVMLATRKVDWYRIKPDAAVTTEAVAVPE